MSEFDVGRNTSDDGNASTHLTIRLVLKRQESLDTYVATPVGEATSKKCWVEMKMRGRTRLQRRFTKDTV